MSELIDFRILQELSAEVVKIKAPEGYYTVEQVAFLGLSKDRINQKWLYQDTVTCFTLAIHNGLSVIRHKDRIEMRGNDNTSLSEVAFNQIEEDDKQVIAANIAILLALAKGIFTLPKSAEPMVVLDSLPGYDFNRPYVGYDSFQTFKAIDPEIASKYGQTVIATQLSNSEYNARYAKLGKKNNMKSPPGAAGHKFMGWLVVRRFGTKRQYETWMPEMAFEDCYALASK